MIPSSRRSAGATGAALPAVVRLAPQRSVLALGHGSRLLGLDPAGALAVEALAPPLAAMLDELAGPAPTAPLLDRAVARGATRADAQQLLGELLAAGTVIDASEPHRKDRRRADSIVVVSGTGPLAVGVLLGLAAGGVGTVHVRTSGTVGIGDLGTGLVDADRGRDRAAAVAAALTRLLPRVVTGPPPQRVEPDLVVLADAGAPDPVDVTALHAAGTAHLPVRMRDGVGVVGPLVLPGRTTCLGCLEIQRHAYEPDWLTVSAQLVGAAGRAAPAGITGTVGLATAQALAALDAFGGAGTEPVPTVDATLELDVDAATLVRRRWVAQPRCGCGAHAIGRRHAHRGGVGHGATTCAEASGQDTIME